MEELPAPHDREPRLNRPGTESAPATRVMFGFSIRWLAAAAVIALLVFALAVRAWMLPGDYQAALENGHYKTAERLLLKKANEGDTVAQNALANLYYLGLGPERDYRQAAKWYLKAALAGNGNAQINMSHLYRLGLGVPQDKLRSLGWLTQARSNNAEAAEKQIKWHSVRLQLSVNQLMYVRQTYPTLRSLAPDAAPGTAAETAPGGQ